MVFSLFTILFSSHAFAATAGTRDYDYATHQMKFFDGTHWYAFNIGLPLGACSAGEEAKMEFLPVLAVYEYCNGTNWIKVIGVPILLASCTQKGAMDYAGGTYRVCNGLLWTDIKGLQLLS